MEQDIIKLLDQCINIIKSNNKVEQSMFIDVQFQIIISNFSHEMIKKYNSNIGWTSIEISIVDKIIYVCNIIYNNSCLENQLLDDGIYDQLLQAYKSYDPNYLVGADPRVNIESNEESIIEYKNPNEKELLYELVDNTKINNSLYGSDIRRQEIDPFDRRPQLLYSLVKPPITKRLINTEHKYPQLVGTLDKCKFVLNEEARQAGVFNDASVQIFERDYIHLCLSQNIIHPNEKFSMLAELKYDGVSIEAEVCGDRIISALSRGDTGANIATDLTPIFSDYRFYKAKNVPTDQKFGIKFEAVITYRNLEILSEIKRRSYKNGRNAIIGILGSSDAYVYTNLITLIPLCTSLDWSSHCEYGRLAELEFLNTYYHSGELNRHVVLNGNYQEILFQVKAFTESAEYSRQILPYMIDGVVISFIDPNKIKLLGRINSVNKYQMAIKFNPKEVRTIFLGYSFNIGKSGEVIPMVHFKPVEFIGTIHNKQTIHSFQRFKELALIPGQEIDIKYVNDVLTYITKPDTENNRYLQNTQSIIPFIDKCPYCDSEIIISETGRSAKCPNMLCHERMIMRMVDMIDKLGFTDFSEETIRDLDNAFKNNSGFSVFNDIIKPYTYEQLLPILGPLTSQKFLDHQKRLLSEPIYDYLIMAALSFDNMGIEKWKLVLSKYQLKVLLGYSRDQLYAALSIIHGVGPGIINSIIDGFTYYHNEIECIINNIHIIDSYNPEGVNKPKIVITGFRNSSIIDFICSFGYDCSENYNVTKDTYALITNDINSNSSKIIKARKYNIPIIPLTDLEPFLKGELK